jgi:hypothetical protein
MSPNIQVNSPYILAQSNVAVALAPNGTVATNGIVTLVTALPRIYSSGIWLRFPAGAVVGGSAGLYWCDMTSTTVGQVYTNFTDALSPFTPSIPVGILTNAIGSNSSYTQTVNTNIVLASVTNPPGSLGNNGQMRINEEFSYNLAAGAKSLPLYLNTASLLTSPRSTTGGHDTFTCRLKNNGIQSSNTFSVYSESSATGTIATVATAQDLSLSSTIYFNANIDTATNYMILESFSLEILPSS